MNRGVVSKNVKNGCCMIFGNLSNFDSCKNKLFYKSGREIGEKMHYDKKILNRRFWKCFLKNF